MGENSNIRTVDSLDDADVTLDEGVVHSIAPPTMAQDSHPVMRLVHGITDSSSTSVDTGQLQYRLKIAAYGLSTGYLLFFVWRLLDITPPGKFEPFWHYGGLGVGIGLGVLGLYLSSGNQRPLWKLRICEAVTWGLPCIFFFFAECFVITRALMEDKLMPPMVAPWMILIFTYALFVPNRWPRAATIIGLIALAPCVMVLALWMASPLFAAFLAEDPSVVPVFILSISVAAGLAIMGATVIGTLRQQAVIGKKMGQYNLRQLIGSGGMGEVYLGEHQLLKRQCAIKTIRPEKAGDPRTLKRFEREVRTSAKLSHWNNIDVFDYGSTEDGTFYYVMEFLPGLNLFDLVNRFGPLLPERVIYLLLQTCDALGEAHGIGFLHRDIKPANIFAAYRGGIFDVAKLLDFGLTKPVAAIPSTQLSIEGAITGSPHYMSPEQILGEDELDPRSDIYSLGTVAYFLLTGRPPFSASQAMKVLMAHVKDPLEPLSKYRADIPADLEKVVLRCLEKSPDDRFQSVQELAGALRKCVDADGWNRHRAAQWWTEHIGLDAISNIEEGPLEEEKEPVIANP